MGSKPRFTAEKMAETLVAHRGMVFLTAKALGCHHDTVQNYINKYPTVRAARDASRGEMVDEAEARLWRAIAHNEPWAIAFCLRTLGKDRGYVPQVEQKNLTDYEGLASLLQQARTPAPLALPPHVDVEPNYADYGADPTQPPTLH
jgi:hypothetical protein